MKFQRALTLTGWGVFLAGFIVFTATVEPTASFWDCGEFIATAHELEVPHPPGAPLWLTLGRVFSMFAPPDQVAFMVNMISVLSSAFVGLFTCWAAILLAWRGLQIAGGLGADEDPVGHVRLKLLATGLVAGLTSMFIDTVWFSAVEAEVYAASSMFTTLVFWLILKWERRADEPGSNRLLVFIAYIMGLAIGVHLLPLLAIPVIGLVYYLRRYKYTTRGAFVAVALFLLALVIVQVGVVQTTWEVAWRFERFFTGTLDPGTNKTTGLGLPFGTGAVVFALLLLGGLGYAIYYTHQKRHTGAHMLLMSLLMIYLGFTSYAVITIRSNADPAVDQNDPGNIVSFLSYVKREQYGQKPLLSGPMYNSRPSRTRVREKLYVVLPEQDRYVYNSDRLEYEYSGSEKRFFPRMYDPGHYRSGPFGYAQFVKNKGQDPNNPYDDKVTGLENLKFFFQYQVYHMYWRYFFWNFAGRESDVQHSPYESGLIGPGADMPQDMATAATRNHYYFLPLLLGLIGLFWHLYAHPKGAAVVGLLFFMTGLAIVLYLNQVAQEPRERDYAFVGSFHTFAIWVGMGVMGLAAGLQYLIKKLSAPIATALASGLALVMAPVLLLAENWDDHNRSGRYLAPDTAYNLLNSCEPNAILFTNGDNDTFPLWYLQEVEGVRTDVRVVNLSLLNTDWYIYQLKYKKWNQAEPLPISLPDQYYLGENNQTVDYARYRVPEMPIDPQQVVANGLVQPEEASKIPVGKLPLVLRPHGRKGQEYLYKQDVVILDMLAGIARDGWKRPIYFANTVAPSSFIGLEQYFELQGFAYRIIPILDAENSPQRPGRINLELTHDKLTRQYRYRGLNNPDLFFDDNSQRMVSNTRSSFFRLAHAYLDEAEKLDPTEAPTPTPVTEGAGDAQAKAQAASLRQKATEVVDFANETISPAAVPLDGVHRYLAAAAYSRAGQTARADTLMEEGRAQALERLRFYNQATDYVDGSFMAEENSRELVRFLDTGIQLYMQNKRMDKALLFAQTLSDATGDSRRLNEVRAMMAPPAAPADSAAKPAAAAPAGPVLPLPGQP